MPGRTIALLDDSGASRAVLAHAVCAARALDFPLTLVRALDAPNGGVHAPVDAVEWSLRRNRATIHLGRDAAEARRLGVEVETALLDAPDHRSARRLLEDGGVALAVVPDGARRATSAKRAIVDTAAQIGVSLLFVPAGDPPTPPYRRVLAAIDCSSRAACALDVAATLAQGHDAELIIAHVVPVPEMPRLGVPYTADERELRRAVVRRNERVACTHLGRLRAELSSRGVAVRTRTVASGRIGPSIADLAREERPDLVVIGAAGHGGDEVAPVWPYGSVARSLMDHLTVPLLIHRAERVEPVRDDASHVATRQALNVPRFSG